MSNGVAFWESEVERLSSMDVSKMSEDELIDHGIELAEAKDQLNFAWQDDELDSQGLPHPWGF